MPWEYMHVQAGTSQMQELDRTLNRLGAEDWEVVGFASADKTIGLNSVVCILKRHYEAMAPPPDASKGWKRDPAGHQWRWWTGEHWSARVSDDKKESTDWPRLLHESIDPPRPGPPKPQPSP